jgi:hypothetical protein
MEKKFVPARYLQTKKPLDTKLTVTSKKAPAIQAKDKENVPTNTKSLAEQLIERRLAKAAIKTGTAAKKPVVRTTEEPKVPVHKKPELKPKAVKAQKPVHSEDLALILTARIYQHRVVRQRLEAQLHHYATEKQVFVFD